MKYPNPNRAMKHTPVHEVEHHPRIRIDIDNINDVPKVWIDGKRVDEIKGDTLGLVELTLSWQTQTDRMPDNLVAITYGVHDSSVAGSYVKTMRAASPSWGL